MARIAQSRVARISTHLALVWTKPADEILKKQTVNQLQTRYSQ